MKKPNQYLIWSACQATQIAEEAIFPLEGEEDIEDDYEEEEEEFDKEAFYKEHGYIPIEYSDLSVKGGGNYALFVGINKYTNGHDLRGCVNDANGLKHKFTSEMGWNEENVRILLDSDATKINIMDGLKWLLSHKQDHCELLFTFSGHGSWTLTSQNGFETCLCCTDCGDNTNIDKWDNGIITKSELRALIENRDAESNLLVILDCCFSGGMGEWDKTYNDLPEEVKKIFGETPQEERDLKNIRALVGPIWETYDNAKDIMKLSVQELQTMINKQKLISRNSCDGTKYVIINKPFIQK